MSLAERFVDRLAAIDHFTLICRLSLLLLVVNTNEHPIAFVISAAGTAVLFLRPDLMRSPFPWFALAAVAGVSQLDEWWMEDDHTVVTTYWMVGLGLSRLADDRDRVLSISARLLVGLVFAFAFGWKLLSSQFVSTDFFRYEFAFDDRFQHVAELVGGTDDDQRAGNLEELNVLYTEGEAGDVIVVEEGPRNEDVADLFTIWGVLIEGAVALAFLLPLPRRVEWLRPATLFAFAYTTYLVVPVAGFGALLMTLGLAHRDTPRLRAAYVVSFGALLVWGGIFPLLL